jgi:predicted nuclease of predicted toxin-antitoxin system
MKIKLDENLPARLAITLSELGHDTDTVVQEGLAAESDAIVWHAAQSEGRLLVTQDLDFSDIRDFVPGTHHGIVLIRLRDPSRIALIERLISLFRSEQVEEWTSCFVVVTEHKFRVKKPRES